MKINRILIKLGGGDLQILELIPREKQRFVLNGLLNLINCLTMTLSLYIIGDELFGSSLLRFLVPVTFGLMELLIYQYMAVTFYSGRSRWIALPRIVFSAVFALLIAQILKLEVFRDLITMAYHNQHPKISNAGSISFLDRQETFETLNKFGTTIWWAGTLITLTFIIINALPYLAGFFGTTDKLYRHVLQQKNEEKVKELHIEEMKMDLKVEAEMKANEELLHAIAEKQTMLAKRAVETWYQQEIAKLKLEEIKGDDEETG